MARIGKKECPKCGFYNIRIMPDTQIRLVEMFAKYEKDGRKKYRSEMFNKILSEYFFAKDNDATFRHYNQFFCKSETMCADRELNGFPNSKCNACDKYSKV